MIMNYKGYTAQIDIDLDANVIFGRVLDIRTVITFETEHVEDVRGAFEEAIEDYLDYCAARGKEPERPYAGNISLRTSPRNHRLFAEVASAAGLSMNTWIERTLVHAVEQTPSESFTAHNAAPLSRKTALP